MRRRSRSNANLHTQAPAGQPFTRADVRLMLSSPVYAYGINLLPAERVAEEVMKLNAQLAQEIREIGTTFTLAELNQRFMAPLREVEGQGTFYRGESVTPIISKEQWLQAYWNTIRKLVKSVEL